MQEPPSNPSAAQLEAIRDQAVVLAADLPLTTVDESRIQPERGRVLLRLVSGNFYGSKRRLTERFGAFLLVEEVRYHEIAQPFFDCWLDESGTVLTVEWERRRSEGGSRLQVEEDLGQVRVTLLCNMRSVRWTERPMPSAGVGHNLRLSVQLEAPLEDRVIVDASRNRLMPMSANPDGA